MEKIAQARWRKAIDRIDTSTFDGRTRMQNFVSNFNRNDRFMNAAYNDEMSPLLNAANGTIKDKPDIKRAISKYINRPSFLNKRLGTQANTSVSTWTPEQRRSRLRSLMNNAGERGFVRRIQRKEGAWNSPDNSFGPFAYSRRGMTQNPDDYVDIISGTNKAKGMAFLQGGNAANKLESEAMLPSGKLSGMGLQVHSRITERAPGYARMSADSRGGQPAILKGQIKRKYLYPNANHGSSGDEYGIPRELYSKIRNGRIEDLSGNVIYRHKG